MLLTMSLFIFWCNMATSKITPTVYESTGKDKVKKADASTITAGNPINTLPEGKSQIGLAKNVGGLLGLNKITGLTKTLKDWEKKGVSFDPAVIKERYKNLNKNLDSLGGVVLSNVLRNSGFLGDPEEIVEGLLGATKGRPLSEVLAYQKETVALVIDGTKNIIKNIKDFDPRSISDVAKMISSVAGDSDLAKILDMDSEFAMLKTLNDASIKLGIPKALDYIVDKVKDDKPQLRRVLLDGLPTALSNGDISYISTTVDQVGKGFVLAKSPEVINQLVTSYQLPPGEFIETEELKDQLLITLEKIDPKWNLHLANGVEVINLGIFESMNDTVRNLLKLDPRYVSSVICASLYPPADTATLFKNYYPFY